jgi:hypothetical protein
MALIGLLALIAIVSIVASVRLAVMLRTRPAAQYDVLKAVWFGGVLDGISASAILALISVLIAMYAL